MVACCSVVATVSAAPRATAQSERNQSPAADANRGLHLEIAPILIIPSGGGPLGGGLSLDGRYGFDAGPTIIGPGGRLSGYFISGRFIGIAMPTLRVTLPIGPLAPYVLGGVGGGWLSNPGEGGLALLAGGGLMVHFGRVIAVGVEVTYQKITGTGFEILAIGPAIAFGS